MGKRLVCAAVAVGAIAALVCAAYTLIDMRSFEWHPLFVFLGFRGVAFAALLIAGLVVCAVIASRAALVGDGAIRLGSLRTKALLLAWVVAIVWLAEWVFMEEPVTVQVADRSFTDADSERVVAEAVRQFSADGSIAALTPPGATVDEQRLATMLARIAVNRPSVFDGTPIGVIIAKQATRYGVNPILLLHWAYIDSFYGEAPSGRMPFFREINGEMFRDLVQAHLPWWFVENPLRVALIEKPWLRQIAGDYFGQKLQYAFQKATYDIAISPFMNSVYSDLFLILREYPEEFPELFGDGGQADPLARSFLAVRDVALQPPYDQPYARPRRDGAYYAKYRADLITFGRAAVYRLSGDFEFAAKVQALVARYYQDQYARRIGPERWSALSDREQTALLAMLRDVYVPNIGHVSDNLYLVPEFNTTPIVFLSEELAKDFDAAARGDKTWVPADGTRLWGATALMLHVLSETWEVETGSPLPGVLPAKTVPDAIKVLARY